MLFLNLKAIVIDLDGTLVDTIPIFEKIHKEILKRYGIVLQDSLDTNGSSPKEMIYLLSKKYNIELNYEKILEEAENIFLEKYIDNVKFTPGAKEFLIYIKEKKYKLGLYTSNSKKLASAILDKLGIRTMFDCIITGNDINNLKPEPDGYLKILECLNVKPYEVIAIEDSIYGVISAKRAGINVIAVLTGVSKKKELASVGATLIFKNLKELKKYFEDQDKYNNHQ